MINKHTAAACLAVLIASSALAAKPAGTVKRQLMYPGLPTITYLSDGDGRLTDVSVGGRPVVSYDWSEEPYAVPVRFFGRWSINTSVMPDGSGTQQVIDAAGGQHASGVVLAHARGLGRPTMLLDALAADLGLAPGWQEGQQVTSANDVQLRANGKTISIKYHSVGQGARVGESEGKATLWDLDLPLGVTGRLGEIVPSRLIVTSSGAVHLAADIPVVGAFDGIWTNDPSGERVTFRKQLDTPSSGATHATSMSPHAEMLWICGMSEYWWSWTDGINWWYGNYYVPTYCDSGGGGCIVTGLEPSSSSVQRVTGLSYCGGDGGDGSGGTPTPPPVDPEITQLQGQYANCPPTPPESDFITSAQFSDPQGHFSFGELSDPSYSHAIITSGLINGLESTRTSYGGSISVNSGYRAPGTNAGTAGSAACSDHIRGTAADLNIRNATGAHDCAVWDALAAAGHAAGAWVEPWSELVLRGTPNHVHLDFGRTQNQPADYGTCNPAEVSP